MWILISLFKDVREKEVKIGFSIQNKPCKVNCTYIEEWQSDPTVVKWKETGGFIHISLIFTEIHCSFWSLSRVFPKEETSQTLELGTINYLEKCT